MNLAACLAVAHSPLAGGLSHVLELGATWRTCDSVRVVERGIKGNEKERGWAVVGVMVVNRVVRVRRVVRGLGSMVV